MTDHDSKPSEATWCAVDLFCAIIVVAIIAIAVFGGFR